MVEMDWPVFLRWVAGFGESGQVRGVEVSPAVAEGGDDDVLFFWRWHDLFIVFGFVGRLGIWSCIDW